MRIPALAAVALLTLGLVGPAASAPSGKEALSPERPTHWAQRVPETSVNNLFQLTPSLYRSAKLSRSDVPQLEALGIRKVISLRAFHSDERILAGSTITVEHIPVHTWRIRDREMVAVLKALRHVDRDGPVLIHCQHGADRTGLVSALYRVVYQGWTPQQALEELQRGGYGFHAIWQNIRRYLEQVDVERLRAQVMAGDSESAPAQQHERGAPAVDPG